MTYTEKECWRAFGAGTIVGGLGVFVVMGTIVYTTEWGKLASTTLPTATKPSREVDVSLEVHLRREVENYRIAKAKGDKKGWVKPSSQKRAGVQVLTTERPYPFLHLDYANPYCPLSRIPGGAPVNRRLRLLGK